MPGETYQTLKSKYTAQTGSSTLGTAMANQAAQVASSGQTEEQNKEFSGDQTQQALSGQTPQDIQNNEEQQEIIAKEIIDTAEKEKKKKEEEDGKKYNLFDFAAKYAPSVAFAKGIGGLLEKILGGKPRPEQMSDPNSLSIIRSLFLDEQGNLDQEALEEYYERNKDIIDKGILDSGIGSLEAAEGNTGLTGLDAFSNIIMSANPAGIQGTESQRRLDPESFYDLDLYKTLERPVAMEDYPKFLQDLGLRPLSSRFANTSGNLANIASIDVNMLGPDGKPLSREFKQKIFDARMELDRMGKDMFGNTQGGGQGGGGGIYTPPVTPPVNPTDPTDPNPTLPITTPQIPTSRFPDSVIRDYTQLGLPQIYGNQQIPNYGNFYQGQGGQPIGLQNYLDNLRKRFGIG